MSSTELEVPPQNAGVSWLTEELSAAEGLYSKELVV
jgi:hypothetical protein